MSNNELQNAKEELIQIYNKYIDKIAQDTLEKKPVDQALIEETNKIMSKIRDWDIVISMNKQKENSEEINKTM